MYKKERYYCLFNPQLISEKNLKMYYVTQLKFDYMLANYLFRMKTKMI